APERPPIILLRCNGLYCNRPVASSAAIGRWADLGLRRRPLAGGIPGLGADRIAAGPGALLSLALQQIVPQRLRQAGPPLPIPPKPSLRTGGRRVCFLCHPRWVRVPGPPRGPTRNMVGRVDREVKPPARSLRQSGHL